MVQIGIPFLDPVGDAPVVQILSKRAIENGFTVEEFFKLSASSEKKLLYPSYSEPTTLPYLAMEKTGLCRHAKKQA